MGKFWPSLVRVEYLPDTPVALDSVLAEQERCTLLNELWPLDEPKTHFAAVAASQNACFLDAHESHRLHDDATMQHCLVVLCHACGVV